MSEQNKDSEIHEFAGYVYKFLQQYVSLSESDFNQFLPFLEVRRYAKREEVLKYGQVDEYLNLVVKGILRKYVLVGKNEKTLQIATEGQIIQSEISFHTRVPSTVIIDAIEPSILVSIRYDHVEFVLDKIPEAEVIGRQMMTYLFIKKDAKYFAQLNTTTRERFLNYLTSHPHMLQRVPQKVLASYLEIKPETFSRLKHLLKT
jgi:CRP-like cAMP-binding protein